MFKRLIKRSPREKERKRKEWGIYWSGSLTNGMLTTLECVCVCVVCARAESLWLQALWHGSISRPLPPPHRWLGQRVGRAICPHCTYSFLAQMNCRAPCGPVQMHTQSSPWSRDHCQLLYRLTAPKAFPTPPLADILISVLPSSLPFTCLIAVKPLSSWLTFGTSPKLSPVPSALSSLSSTLLFFPPCYPLCSHARKSPSSLSKCPTPAFWLIPSPLIPSCTTVSRSRRRHGEGGEWQASNARNGLGWRGDILMHWQIWFPWIAHSFTQREFPVVAWPDAVSRTEMSTSWSLSSESFPWSRKISLHLSYKMTGLDQRPPEDCLYCPHWGSGLAS